MTPTLTPCTETLGKMDYVPATGWRFCVTFDFADATHFVYERHESDNLIPFRNFHGHAATYELPTNTDASMFEEWAAEVVQPLLERIKAGHTTAWKDGNEIGVFDYSAICAIEQLDNLFDHDNYSMAAISQLKNWQGRFDAEEYLWEIRHELIEGHAVRHFPARRTL